MEDTYVREIGDNVGTKDKEEFIAPAEKKPLKIRLEMGNYLIDSNSLADDSPDSIHSQTRAKGHTLY